MTKPPNSSAEILPPTTAAINPEKFSNDIFFPNNRTAAIVLLTLFIIAGGALRLTNLGAESLSEDELNKWQTVAEYRSEGLSGRNGEHPFLMKGLQTLSVSAAERINRSTANAALISDEAALRLPTALVGTLSILLIYLLITELFGAAIGSISSALYALDPNAVGFDRVAKEDSFLLFFFLLASFFWIRAQSRAERGSANWINWTRFSAIGFGAMVASKYLPHLLAVAAAYYQCFQNITATRWRLGKSRWLMFFIIIGISFLIFNPTILLPETWREMLTFSGEKRIGHDAYEFMGTLYQNKVTAWLAGVPWTFYFVFIAVKTPLATLLFFLAGLFFVFRKNMGDGRIFIFFWALMWFMPFSVLGGKFTRYFAVAEPLVLIVAAVGFYYFLRLISDKFFGKLSNPARGAAQTITFLIFVSFSLAASLSVAPYFRLYTNLPGGGNDRAGFYFPHDEFYDTSTNRAIGEIVRRARANALVAVETPALYEFYARRANRDDLVFISLSDPAQIERLGDGDFVIAAAGRRYFSNDDLLNYLNGSAKPVAEIKVFDEVISVKVFQLDAFAADEIRKIAK